MPAVDRNVLRTGDLRGALRRRRARRRRRVRGAATWSATSPPTSLRPSSTASWATSSATAICSPADRPGPAGWARDLRRRAASRPPAARSPARLDRTSSRRSTISMSSSSSAAPTGSPTPGPPRSTARPSSPRSPGRPRGPVASCSPSTPTAVRAPGSASTTAPRAAPWWRCTSTARLEEADGIAGGLYAWAEEQAAEICRAARGDRDPAGRQPVRRGHGPAAVAGRRRLHQAPDAGRR